MGTDVIDVVAVLTSVFNFSKASKSLCVICSTYCSNLFFNSKSWSDLKIIANNLPIIRFVLLPSSEAIYLMISSLALENLKKINLIAQHQYHLRFILYFIFSIIECILHLWTNFFLLFQMCSIVGLKLTWILRASCSGGCIFSASSW